ncbi:MAG: tryptophan synthase subunit alpha [Candidatus Omnitrophica bacterium]|nr:tryptophan synthase subunit alpha [Candidatus Omnitrophota bacterium]
MSRIEKRFKEIKAKKKKAFIAYICAGDPDLATTKRLVLEFDKAGVDIIELGVPFSDPLADGPTIQRASQRALKKRVNLPKIFLLIKELRKNTEMPLVLMIYYNLIYDYGVNKFVRDAKGSGADGVIVPDLIPEEADELVFVSRAYDFNTIFLAAPTSTKERIRLIANKSTGFIYYVSLTGVTGARKSLSGHVREHIREIKHITKKPICVGFGVSTPKQVRQLSRFCDGVIVGSAIINKLEKNIKNKNRAIKEAAAFVKSLAKGVK